MIPHGESVTRPPDHDQSIHQGSDVTNAQVVQALKTCTNLIQQQVPGGRKDLLEELKAQVQQLLEALLAEKQEEVAGNLELAVKAATSTKPNRAWYSVSTEGLLEAAKDVPNFSGKMEETIRDLGKSLWPDFVKPEPGMTKG